MQVVCKPTAAVMPAFVQCLLSALRHGMHVVVEPKAFSLLAMQLRRLLAAAQATPAADNDVASQSGVERLWDPFAESGATPRSTGCALTLHALGLLCDSMRCEPGLAKHGHASRRQRQEVMRLNRACSRRSFVRIRAGVGTHGVRFWPRRAGGAFQSAQTRSRIRRSASCVVFNFRRYAVCRPSDPQALPTDDAQATFAHNVLGMPRVSSGCSREGLSSFPFSSLENGGFVGAPEGAPFDAALPPPPPPVRVPGSARCRSWAGHDTKVRRPHALHTRTPAPRLSVVKLAWV